MRVGGGVDVDVTKWNRFETWVKANLRLGRTMQININRHGGAECESDSPKEADDG
jgi:hypothetical protein